MAAIKLDRALWATGLAVFWWDSVGNRHVDYFMPAHICLTQETVNSLPDYAVVHKTHAIAKNALKKMTELFEAGCMRVILAEVNRSTLVPFECTEFTTRWDIGLEAS